MGREGDRGAGEGDGMGKGGEYRHFFLYTLSTDVIDGRAEF